jgi:hypothetical protein
MFCACPASSRVLLLTIAVVQVPWLPEVTQGHVTPSVSTLLGPFDLKTAIKKKEKQNYKKQKQNKQKKEKKVNAASI